MTNSKGTSQLVLPHYTLDSSLVLLPGIIYNVSFSRFKASALLARYNAKVSGSSLIKQLLSEYDFDSADSEAATLSNEAFDGIRRFFAHEARSSSGRGAKEDPVPSTEFDWLVMAVVPNHARIDPTGSAVEGADTATICRIVSVAEDSNNVKITFQALKRAKILSGDQGKSSESLVSVGWAEVARNAREHFRTIKASTQDLFVVINGFLDHYRSTLASQGKNTDLMTLNPLANALFLQLAGAKDFENAYGTLQKIMSGNDVSQSTRGLSRVVDLTAAIVPFPNHEKLRILVADSLEDRVSLLVELLEKIKSVFSSIGENNQIATHWFVNEASNLQKANLVANQLKSIRLVLEGLTKAGKPNSPPNQLVRRKGSPMGQIRGREDNSRDNEDDGTDDDDLKAITDFIKNKLPKVSSISEDSKRLILKDYKRVKSASPGNADFHVIRNYLDIVVDMPWDKYVARFTSNKDINLNEAKRQLDEDHYGLDNVKTRLLQYLVVLKLLDSNAEKDSERIKLIEAEKSRKAKEKAESRKFTRESPEDDAVVIANKDEASKPSPKQAITEKEQQEINAVLTSKVNKSPIIMLAGPPGVGKTSLAKSIATTLGRKFQRISLGGVKDESEIRGHRRTYVGAMAGNIVQALRKSGSMNPVILLDEIDKVVGGQNAGTKFNGDPSAALLEVLDPEQNTHFMDHYLGFPIDLSQVIFICTANEPHNMSRPLLDRLEMIEIGAYDYSEKLVIGDRYLLPRQIKRNGFPDGSLINIDEEVLRKVILDYTREAGVRNLERKLGTICRYKAVEYSESLTDSKVAYQPKVEEYDLAKYLGLPLPSLSNDIVDVPTMASNYGVVNGLSYNSDGTGSVLTFESIGFNNEKGGLSLNMTGRLGEVLMESAKIGLTFIKSILHREVLDLNNSAELLQKLNSMEIHMHVPSGAISKDGPSAGITMALSFLALILERPVPSSIAMTGEITLRGLVLPIGGLREKLLGAHLTGHINKVIVPRDNRRDLLEEYVHKINDPSQLNELLKDDAEVHFKNSVAEDYFAEKYGVRVVYAKEFGDVISHVWGDELLARKMQARMDAYHL